PVPWLQMTNMISYQGLVRTFPYTCSRYSIGHCQQMTQVLIGDIYLRQQCDVFWLGYTISPAYARQGYAIEAITATID
ncbi:hypothetical protein PRZ85_20925, partial [Escherichia coli]|nr:hypothetical protein [Escherichia coli]